MHRWLGVLLTCAWVLWSQLTVYRVDGMLDASPSWHLDSAHETKAACEQAQERVLTASVGRGFVRQGVFLTDYSVRTTHPRALDRMVRYHICLPSEVDPRTK
jgi:hypothetical protein